MEKFDIEKLIETIRRRPLMFLPSKSIGQLSIFISGAYFAQRMMEGPESSYDDDILSAFGKKVVERYSIETNHAWPSILLFKSGGEEEAFQKFFELWDEFIEELH